MSRRKSSKGKPRNPPQLVAAQAGASQAAAFWLFGRHTVLAVLANRARRVERLLALPETAAALTEAAAHGHASRQVVETVERSVLAACLPAGAVHQGMAALVQPLAEMTLDDVLASAQAERCARAVVVLDQIEDPRNVGAVLRSAAAFGASALIAQTRHAPGATAQLAKAASGALEVVPLIRVVNIARTLDRLQDASFVCLGLDAGAEQTLAAAAPAGNVAFVLGSEGRGLRRLVREGCDSLIRIPISDAVESLNVAATAAIALYEWHRHCGFRTQE